MHLLVYQERSDINGIVHTHSPYATSFAVTGMGIPVLNGEAASLGGTIECARFNQEALANLGRQHWKCLETVTPFCLEIMVY